MKSLFYRVDEKFIHAQTLHGWLPHLNVKNIIGISEEIAGNPDLKDVYLEALPAGINLEVYHPDQVSEIQTAINQSDDQLILFSSLKDVENFIAAGGEIGSLNIGGIYCRPNRKKYLSYIHLTDGEAETLSKLTERCADIYCQDTPRSQQVKVSELLQWI